MNPPHYPSRVAIRLGLSYDDEASPTPIGAFPVSVEVLPIFFAAPVFTEACWIESPDQGLNPSLLHWKHQVLATGPPGKSVHWGPLFGRRGFRLNGQSSLVKAMCTSGGRASQAEETASAEAPGWTRNTAHVATGQRGAPWPRRKGRERLWVRGAGRGGCVGGRDVRSFCEELSWGCDLCSEGWSCLFAGSERG